MPVEIKELIVRTVVEDESVPRRDDKADNQAINTNKNKAVAGSKTLVQESVRQTLSILAQKRER